MQEDLNESFNVEDAKNWTCEEVDAVIDLWEEYCEDVKLATRNSAIYEKLALLLQQKLKRKIPFTGIDIFNKVEILKNQYE